MVGLETRFITLEEAQSLETRAFIAAAVTSLRSRAAALGVADELARHNEVWFLDRSEAFTLKGVRSSFLRYVAPCMLSVFALNTIAHDSPLAKVVMLVFLNIELVIIVRSGLRLASGTRAIHFHYKAVWDGLDPSHNASRSP